MRASWLGRGSYVASVSRIRVSGDSVGPVGHAGDNGRRRGADVQRGGGRRGRTVGTFAESPCSSSKASRNKWDGSRRPWCSMWCGGTRRCPKPSWGSTEAGSFGGCGRIQPQPDEGRPGTMNLAACDRQRAVVFEITSKNVVARGAEDHLLACTNHFRTPELSVGNNGWRYRVLEGYWERSQPFSCARRGHRDAQSQPWPGDDADDDLRTKTVAIAPGDRQSPGVVRAVCLLGPGALPPRQGRPRSKVKSRRARQGIRD